MECPGIRIPGEPPVPPETDYETGIAAPTAATDESRFVPYRNGNLVCLDMDGNRKWAKNIGTPQMLMVFVFLIIYEGLLVVKFDSNDKSPSWVLIQARRSQMGNDEKRKGNLGFAGHCYIQRGTTDNRKRQS